MQVPPRRTLTCELPGILVSVPYWWLGFKLSGLGLNREYTEIIRILPGYWKRKRKVQYKIVDMEILQIAYSLIPYHHQQGSQHKHQIACHNGNRDGNQRDVIYANQQTLCSNR